MTTFEIPVSHKGQPIIEIDDYAFEQCTNLKSIIIPATVEYINKDSFYNLNKNCVLYFEGKKEKYPSCYISNFECYFQNKENSSDSKQEWTGNY